MAQEILLTAEAYKKKYDEISIEFDPKFIGKIVGEDISKEFIVKTLKALEFELTEKSRCQALLLAEVMFNDFLDRGYRLDVIQSHTKGVNPDIPESLAERSNVKINTIIRKQARQEQR